MMHWFATAKRYVVIVVLDAALTSVGHAAPETAPSPIIRAELTPRLAVVGQTVTLKVDVLVPSWFTAPIDYPPTINVAGITAQLSNAAAINLNERIDNQSYAGMSKLYTVVARQAGAFELPPVAVKVSYAADGSSRSVTLQSPSQSFRAALPAGAEDLGYFLATANYSLKQTTNGALSRLKVGDAVVRRISQSAEGVAAMNLPGLRFAELDGTSVYPAEAQLSDSGGERGKLVVGERVDAVTYVLRQPGPVTLPGLKIAWFDIGQGKMRWSSVPPLRFDVAPDPTALVEVKTPLTTIDGVSPAPTGEITPRARLMRAWRSPTVLPILSTFAGLLLLSFLLRRNGIQPISIWRKWWRHRQSKEAAQFKLCLARLPDADAKTALNATMPWLRQITPYESSMSLTQFATSYGDDAFREDIRQQHDELFGRGAAVTQGLVNQTEWNVASYRRGLIKARQYWLVKRLASLQKRTDLPALNPGSQASN
jgi:hypothetical protein